MTQIFFPNSLNLRKYYVLRLTRYEFTRDNKHAFRRVARNSQWSAVLGVWGRSPQPPEANGDVNAKPPAAGGWRFGGKAAGGTGVWGRSPQR